MTIDADLQAQFAELNVEIPPEALHQDDAPDAFEVMPANWAALGAWLACETQWTTAGGGMAGLIWLGLNYAGVDVVLRRLGLQDDVFVDLQVMERAALDVFGEVS